MKIKKTVLGILATFLLFSGCATQNFKENSSLSLDVHKNHNPITQKDVVSDIEKKISLLSISTLQQLLLKASEDGKELAFDENYQDSLLFFTAYNDNLYSLIYKILNDPDSNIYSIKFSKNMIYRNTKKAILDIKYKNKNNSYLDSVYSFERKKIYIKNQSLSKVFVALGFKLIDKTTKNINLSFSQKKKYSIIDVLNTIVVVAGKQNVNLFIKYLPGSREFIIRDNKPYSLKFIDYDFKDILRKNENSEFDFSNFILKPDYSENKITYVGSAEISIYLALRKYSELRYKNFYFGVCSATMASHADKNKQNSYEIIKAGVHKLNRINVILLSIKNIRKFLVIDNKTGKSYVVSTNKNSFVVDNKFLVVY